MSATMHYCGSNLTTVSISSNEHKDCCCSKMKCDCCSDKSITPKLHKAHQIVSNTFLQFNVCSFFSYIIPVTNIIRYFESDFFVSPLEHVPPLIGNQPVYLMNGVFRI